MRRALCCVAGFVWLSVALSSCGSGDGNKKVRDPGDGGAAGAGEPADGGTPGDDVGGGPTAMGGGGSGALDMPSAGAAGFPAHTCTLAETWEVVDDYVHRAGTQTNVGHVAADWRGNVYAAGIGRDEQNMPVGVLRRSLDSGETWGDSGWEGALPNDMSVDAAGTLYVTAGSSTGSVLKSSDQGMSFESVFDIPTTPEPNTPCSTGFVAANHDGVVVAGGSCDDDGWTIHKSEDGGETWQEVFTFLLAPGKASRLHDVAVGVDGTAYASGYGVDENDQVHWLVVRSGSPTGIISDQFQLEAGMAARAFGFDSNGHLLVAGAAADATGTHGVVRRKLSGDEWETLDTFETRAVDVEVLGGVVIVAGQLEVPVNHAITRRSDDAGQTWGESEPYEYAAGQLSFSGSLAVDGQGSGYGVVSAGGEDALSRWVVRRLACE